MKNPLRTHVGGWQTGVLSVDYLAERNEAKLVRPVNLWLG
jgi:hypothetical protein